MFNPQPCAQIFMINFLFIQFQLTDISFDELPRVRLDQPLEPSKHIYDAISSLGNVPEECESSVETQQHQPNQQQRQQQKQNIELNTTLGCALGKFSNAILFKIWYPIFCICVLDVFMCIYVFSYVHYLAQEFVIVIQS